MDPKARVARAVTGMVVAGFGLEPDYEAGRVPCSLCDDDEWLTAGDPVTAVVRNYEGHTWEPVATYCEDHASDSIPESAGAGADEQALVAATLESTGYRDPTGEHHPAALSFGGVDVLAYRSGADEY